MKSYAYTTLLAGGLLLPVTQAASLYDTAPPIGLPVSHAVQYAAYINAGWDSNTNSWHDGEGSAYTSFGVRATYAEYESVTKAAYNANIGGTYYFKDAYGTDQKLFSDINLTGSLSHHMGSGSVLNMSGNLGYRAEPNYASGISSARAQGDVFTWGLNMDYSRPMDARWSWSIGASTDGYYYTEKAYRIDDRFYVGARTGLSYKYTERTSFSGNLSWRYDGREHGYDANNVYAGLSVAHSIDAVSSVSAGVNAQLKFIDGECNVYPNVRFGYNRRLTDVLNMSLYVSLDNENVNTYLGENYNYLSNATWRGGLTITYHITPQVSVFGGADLMFCDYSKGTNGLASSDQRTYSVNVGFSYAVTKSLAWSASYKYTQGNKAAGDYTRNIIQSGLTYSF